MIQLRTADFSILVSSEQAPEPPFWIFSKDDLEKQVEVHQVHNQLQLFFRGLKETLLETWNHQHE
jgi:hypothetical protein